MLSFNANFSKIIGNVKPLHGICMPPLLGVHNTSLFHYLKDAGIPMCRLHDVGGPYGGAHLVDVENIFTDMDADENDPATYDFAFTDNLITALVENGCEPFYRLGPTIENGHAIKYYHIEPPKDNYKWARICANIIRHYNEGWANGFHYNIRYWEIWNEPDGHHTIEGQSMWKGTMEQFFEHYKVVSNHLKKEFPHLKIGGYSSCGFYCYSEVPKWIKAANSTDRFEYFIEFFLKFLEFITSEEGKSPLDFFSFHSYESGDNTALHAKYCRETLDKFGLHNTETILNEWNPADHEKGTASHASRIAAYLVSMHSSPIDSMGFYGGSIGGGNFAALIDSMPSHEPYRAYYAFYAFNKLFTLGNAVEVSDSKPDIYALAATNGAKRAVLVANRSGEKKTVTFNPEIFEGMKVVGHLTAENFIYTEVPVDAEKGEVVMTKDSFILIEAE